MKATNVDLVIDVPLYKVKVHICGSETAYDKFGIQPDDNYEAYVTLMEHSPSKVKCVVANFKKFNAENIAHEMTHAAYRVYDLVGLTHSNENQEPMAYMVGYLVGEVMKYLLDNKVKVEV